MPVPYLGSERNAATLLSMLSNGSIAQVIRTDTTQDPPAVTTTSELNIRVIRETGDSDLISEYLNLNAAQAVFRLPIRDFVAPLVFESETSELQFSFLWDYDSANVYHYVVASIDDSTTAGWILIYVNSSSPATTPRG